MISAVIVADSICNGHRITTMKLTYPRFIHSEMCRHRMFSRNTASSRAIPFRKMLEAIMIDPFIPIAWQRDHKGMQGTEYLNPNETYSINDYLPVLQRYLNEFVRGDAEVDSAQAFEIYTRLLDRYDGRNLTLKGWWLEVRDRVVDVVMLMSMFGLTKQLCNRLLEPWMWTVEIVTATEWENFFHLRCPQYVDDIGKVYRSKKDYMQTLDPTEGWMANDGIEWFHRNKGQAEIHMMALAEAMWDARNESKPKELQPGQWHIPFIDKLHFRENPEEVSLMEDILQHQSKVKIPIEVPISTAMCAQVSYTVVGSDGKTAKPAELYDLHNSLLIRPYTNRKGVIFGPDDPIHASPAEHCARGMTEEEFNSYLCGDYGIDWNSRQVVSDGHGFCKNFRGWIPYRSMIPNENRR